MKINMVVKKKKGYKVDLALRKRDIEVIKLICDEYSSHQIGKKLKLSKKTVENRISLIFLKTKSKNRIDIVKYAIKSGIYILK